MATHCLRRSRKFFTTLRFISGGMASISCRILSFKSRRDRGRCLKTFSFRYPQRKKSHGLKSVVRASHPTSPREHFPQHSERTSCCVSCCTVLLKPHMFCIHIAQFGAQKGLQHFNVPVGGHSYCCTTSRPLCGVAGTVAVCLI